MSVRYQHVHQTNVRQVACGFTYRIKEVFTINLIQITFYIQTRLTLASVLGPFGVHLLTFILHTRVHRCTIWGYGNFRLEFAHHNIHDTYVIYPMIETGLSINFGTLSTCRSFESKDYWTISHCFHRISFCSRVYMSRNASLNITKYMSSTGIIIKFGRLRDILWNVFSSLSPQLHTQKFLQRHSTRLGSRERLRRRFNSNFKKGN